ncbi:MAG: stealth family protein [Micromonosporaceae bacterium]
MAETRTSEPTPSVDYVRSARADLLIGRLYRRVVPARVRQHLRRSTSPEVRQALRLRAGRVVASVARAVEPARVVPVASRRRGAEVVAAWGGRSVLAEVRADLSPLSAMRHNLDVVREALDGAGVPYFLVRGAEAHRFRVAVPADHRATVAEALARAARHRSLYVQGLEGRGKLGLASSRTIRAATRDNYLRVVHFLTDPTCCLTLGPGVGCEIEFWRQEGAELVAPRPNLCADAVPVDEPTVPVPEPVLTAFAPRDPHAPTYPSRPCFAEPIYSDIGFPIDVVYTWVDGHDPAWQARRAATAAAVYHPHAANSARFISHDELRYSLRSVRMNMPWVRTIYLVTDGQVPRWLDRDVPGLHVVDHREIFSDPAVLPVFNSHAIETQLHHIDGLSEHFLYLNDDVCIGRPVTPDRFFLANGITKFFPSPALVPFGEPDDRDVPSSVAGKNNRALIRREFGTLLTHKMKHVPHALRRSILAEIEERFAEEHRRTAASKFRNKTDISVTSSLYHYYAFHTGRAVPGQIRYAYLDLAAPQTEARLRQLLAARDRDVFCVNDTTADGDGSRQRQLLLPFLESYFPVPSVHELREAGPAPLPAGPPPAGRPRRGEPVGLPTAT